MKALVVVPTYNERDNLPPLVAGDARLPGTEVLVVDDQSPDGTGAVADALAAAASRARARAAPHRPTRARPVVRGRLQGAVQTGCRGRGADGRRPRTTRSTCRR
jgi:glycosyltransferase involved in cell wall biosynthesis